MRLLTRVFRPAECKPFFCWRNLCNGDQWDNGTQRTRKEHPWRQLCCFPLSKWPKTLKEHQASLRASSKKTLRCSFKHYAIQDALSYIPFLPMSHNGQNPIMWHWDMVCPISLAWDMGQTMETKQRAQAVKGSFSGAPSPPRPHVSWWAQRLRHLGWAVGKVTKALPTTAITSSRDSK